MMRKLFLLGSNKNKENTKLLRFCLEPRASTKTGDEKLKGEIVRKDAKKYWKLFELNLNIVYFCILKVDTEGENSKLMSDRSSFRQRPECKLLI